MNSVPNIISTKDLAYLSDMYQWNFTVCKKANHYKEEIQNEELKDIIDEVYNTHKEICNKITNILK